MPGGYVTQDRLISPTRITGKGAVGVSLLEIENFIVPTSTTRFGSTVFGAPVDHRVKQSTYSFRTNNRSEDIPDLTSGGEILRYFLLHGVPNDLDKGHDFWTQKIWNVYSHPGVNVSNSGTGTHASGTVFVSGGPPVPVIDSLNVNFYGNRAISRVSPTAPNANLAQTSAEIIREKGIALPGTSLFAWLESRALFYRSLGKEYLNVAFGWKPFLSDLYAIVKQMADITGEIQKYSAISETSTVRRYDFDPIVNTSSSVNTVTQRLTIGPDDNISNWTELYQDGRFSGQQTTVDTSFEKIYFKGRFMFKINPGSGLLNNLQAYEQLANKLLGTRITPSVLWELTPWSWLVDWFVDVQSAMQVAGMFQNDGLLMEYAYLMRRTVKSRTYTLIGPDLIGQGNQGPYSHSVFIEKKERVRGTPFGFGINPEGISPQKWAILAALAISKGPRRLPRFPIGEPTD
ncbi:TPA_asm: maturation protein [ssRNA phage Zoerhiza.2_2]|uniref:Maturation protein n=2 Tax=Leviviricetes TaxID=2842243 RepID=A0A8S5L2H5_9VIRU|nr:maturation protein [ssRNA phage Zoerhiza.2_2]QDH87606.1 MAG: hypothetical protein H2Rhizo31354_000003 [Leviviridae sp.]DAD51620.1 TPA_asm: maturation protein [ssRNA phage Zoerhiza.2_2]